MPFLERDETEGGDNLLNFLQRAKLLFGHGLDDYIQRFLRGDDLPDIHFPARSIPKQP